MGMLYPISLLVICLQMNNCFALVKTTHILTLNEAEERALLLEPGLKRTQMNAVALDQQAVADGQLPDPKFVAGAINVPTNSFNFNQDDMTMIQAGIQQSFLPGNTLALKSCQTKAMSDAELNRLYEQSLSLLKNLRSTWLSLSYWMQARNFLKKNHSLLTELVKIVESQYSVGKGMQSDVIQVQLELARLNDQEIQIKQQIDTLKAELTRWIGQDAIERPINSKLPIWPNPPPLCILQKNLEQHPQFKTDINNVEASRYDVKIAAEQFKPGWMVDLEYGKRQGRMADGRRRSDMVTAQVTVDLPIFTSNRQSRRLQSSAARLESAEFEKDVNYLNLTKELSTKYTTWKNLSERIEIFEKQLIPTAKKNSESTLAEYQSTQGQLTNVIRAYSRELDIQLEVLQIKVDRSKARAELFYLQGVN